MSEEYKGRSAVERGQQMMLVPMSQLPPLAVEFARHLCQQLGGCSEVLLTAWVTYAQCVEGLPCDNDLYLARPCDAEWFAARMVADP